MIILNATPGLRQLVSRASFLCKIWIWSLWLLNTVLHLHGQLVVHCIATSLPDDTICLQLAEGVRQQVARVCVRASMNVGTAHSEVNPNTQVMNSRGIWLSYVLGIGLLHVILLSIPFASVSVVWTLTNLIHNMVSSSSPYHINNIAVYLWPFAERPIQCFI